MTISIIKLLPLGDINEEIISFTNKDTFNLKKFKEEINISENMKELYRWELDNNRILYLIGDNTIREENIHQLPIECDYQYYGDLYCIVVKNGKYMSTDIETFENIYNALYFSIDNDNSSEEEDNQNPFSFTTFTPNLSISSKLYKFKKSKNKNIIRFKFVEKCKKVKKIQI